MKNVFVVDPDIDIISDEQMEWALATRFQADRDSSSTPACARLPLDPSLDPGKRRAPKPASISPCRSAAAAWSRSIPEVPTYGDRRFASIRAALEDGPKRFEELIAAVGSRDGREIVLELERSARRGCRSAATTLGRYTLAKRA